jgi:putative effector of murein hydrolase
MKLEPMPIFWLLMTVSAYVTSRWLYRRTGQYLLSPLILVPTVLLAIAVPMHTAYAEYSTNTHWLMLVLGPVTVAFAIPIWQQRALLARHWPALLIGMLAGSAASIASSFGLSRLLALDTSVGCRNSPRCS